MLVRVVEGVANRQKSKGDRGERDFVAFMQTAYPELVRPDAQRELGAGRREDRGDVRVLYGVTTQVKAWGNVSAALIDAARGALRQKVNASNVLGVGIVKVPHVRPPRPRWLACSLETEWPGASPLVDVPVFRQSGRLLSWMLAAQDDPRVARARQMATTKTARAALPPPCVTDPAQRVAILAVPGDVRIVIAPECAWMRHASSTLQRERALALDLREAYGVVR